MNKLTVVVIIAMVSCAKPYTESPPPIGSMTVKMNYADIRIHHQPPAPPISEEAKTAHVSGTVIVEMTIDPSGLPTKAAAISGPVSLRKLAESYATRWRFEPVKVRGNAQFAVFSMPMQILVR